MTCYLTKLLLTNNASVIMILIRKQSTLKRIMELERIVISEDFKAKPNIIRQ